MVFCKECKQKVEECPHFVDPIQAPKFAVHDEKIEFVPTKNLIRPESTRIEAVLNEVDVAIRDLGL